MAEIETKVLEKYKTVLEKEHGLSPALIETIAAELASDTPNAEKLADSIRTHKDTPSK